MVIWFKKKKDLFSSMVIFLENLCLYYINPNSCYSLVVVHLVTESLYVLTIWDKMKLASASISLVFLMITISSAFLGKIKSISCHLLPSFFCGLQN